MRESEQVIDAGWLVKRARLLGEVTQEALADAAGVDQSVVSRIEGGAQDPGFSRLQSLLGAAGCRLDVCLYPSPPPSPFAAYEHNHAYAVDDWNVRKLMPDGLCVVAGRLDGEREAGPTVGETVYWLGEVQRLRAAVSAPERWLQAAYYDHHGAVHYKHHGYERDRDLAHAVLSCGAGAGQAAAALTTALDWVRAPARRLFARRRPSMMSSIGDLSYAHAVMAIRAEAVICSRAARYCQRSVQAKGACERAEARRVRLRQELEVMREVQAEYGHSDEDAVAKTAVALLEAESDEAQAAEGRKQTIYGGGTPRSDEVGAAGERILISAFAELSRQAWTLYSQMREHPSAQSWRPEPDEAPPIPPTNDA